MDGDPRTVEPAAAMLAPVLASRSLLATYITTVTRTRRNADPGDWKNVSELIEKEYHFSAEHWRDRLAHTVINQDLKLSYGGFEVDASIVNDIEDIEATFISPLLQLIDDIRSRK